ncbi:MAG: class I SAM-dependent DNA methyltransferase [Chromatiaceae bacterium]|nr:class I SAM-dependent DNA methyltransferase [Chromatiaceae bacterium]
MTPDAFIAKWRDVTLKERSAAQEHFLDLCHLLGEPTPAEADPGGTWYCFEKGAEKAGGGNGWADVWKRGCFGWEYKGPGKNLRQAFGQLQNYTPALDYPPLLIVSDTQVIEIHTAFTGLVPEVHVLALEDLRDAARRRLLKWAFSEPERLRPGETTAALTERAAADFGALAQRLRARGHAAGRVAHFSQQLLFCLFAEDIDLLPRQLFTRLLEAGQQRPAELEPMLRDLFAAMARGGRIGFELIDWFNGGLFDSAEPLPLEREDIARLLELARLDWSAIEPSIIGTLFERGLDPDKRAQLGAHYTDPASIMRLIDPVVLAPLRAEWDEVRARMAEQMAKAAKARSASAGAKATKSAQALLQGFLDRLARFRVLDPACGSGNFLLLALRGLKDLEHRVLLDAEALGLPRGLPMVGPENLLGIELNPYAAELARVTVWIGEIQWMLGHGFSLSKNPILKPLETIVQRDAILNPDGSEPDWPEADVIVGNPPFLGDKKMLGALGEEYVKQLRARYKGRVPGGADLVTYWFEKARAHIAAGRLQAAGLVATNSIRGGANRKVLERILMPMSSDFVSQSNEEKSHDDHHVRHPQVHSAAGDGGLYAPTGGRRGRSTQGCSGRPKAGDAGLSGLPAEDRPGGDEAGSDQVDHWGADRTGGGDRGAGQTAVALRIFEAWSDEPWVNEGAAVRVSLVCFGRVDEASGAMLDGQPVGEVYADLTADQTNSSALSDLTLSCRLAENAGICFQGHKFVGAFDISENRAQQWLLLPANPNGRPNSDVLKRWITGSDLTKREMERWVIDFGISMDETDACLYEAPFEHIKSEVKPVRESVRREGHRKYWWRYGEPRPAMRAALSAISRFIATPEVAKYRVFIWLDSRLQTTGSVYAIARSDDTTFGILHSRFHERWSLRMGTSLEDRPRYTPTTTFETFPFPTGLTPADTNRGTETLESGAIVPIVAPEVAEHARAIAEAAHRLNSLREQWLNPPEWTERVPEVVPGYPDRIIAKPGHEADLKKRTLTNLYNQRPAWLDQAHRALDAAVAHAYGWNDFTPDQPDTTWLTRLLTLNLERAKPAP